MGNLEAEPQSLVMARARAEPGNFRESFESYKPPGNCLSKLAANIILLKSIPIPPQRIHYINHIPESDNSPWRQVCFSHYWLSAAFFFLTNCRRANRATQAPRAGKSALTRKIKRGTDIFS